MRHANCVPLSLLSFFHCHLLHLSRLSIRSLSHSVGARGTQTQAAARQILDAHVKIDGQHRTVPALRDGISLGHGSRQRSSMEAVQCVAQCGYSKRYHCPRQCTVMPRCYVASFSQSSCISSFTVEEIGLLGSSSRSRRGGSYIVPPQGFVAIVVLREGHQHASPRRHESLSHLVLVSACRQIWQLGPCHHELLWVRINVGHNFMGQNQCGPKMTMYRSDRPSATPTLATIGHSAIPTLYLDLSGSPLRGSMAMATTIVIGNCFVLRRKKTTKVTIPHSSPQKELWQRQLPHLYSGMKQ